MARVPSKPFLVFSGLLMIVGAYIGMDGGRQHPMISENMGTFGTDPFMLNFARLMTTDPTWMRIHAEILTSTLLMAVAAYAVVLLARRAGETQWSFLGFIGTSLGAVLWICGYMFDGFASPETAKAILAAPNGSSLQKALLQTFASGQWFTIRSSLWAWELTSVGTAFLCIGIFRIARQATGRVYRVLLTVEAFVGFFLGATSLIAWLYGAYNPGPMVSDHAWKPAEIATLLLYLVLGVTILLRGLGVFERTRTEQAPASVEAVPEQVPAG